MIEKIQQIFIAVELLKILSAIKCAIKNINRDYR